MRPRICAIHLAAATIRVHGWPNMEITIQISEESLVDRIASQLRGAMFTDDIDPTGRNLNLENKVRKVMIDQVREATNVAVQRITEEHIETAVKACLDEGWRKTDQYGSPTGPKMTLKDRISETLNKLTDRYGSHNGKLLVDSLIESGITAAMNAEFAPAIAAAKVKFVALLDGSLTQKLTEALKSGLGLR